MGWNGLGRFVNLLGRLMDMHSPNGN